ncbi:lactoylglutathione lyase [Bacilli bacterium PM5-3]|nr:lactoylglutathione lyase [Bacilli bacterium PM5-3]
MNVCWITIQVNNMEQSVKFYTDLFDLKIANNFKVGPMELTFLQANNLQIELIYQPREDVINVNGGISIGVEIDDTNMWFDKLRKLNILFNKDKVVQVDGMKYFFIKDPNGVTIQLVDKK